MPTVLRVAGYRFFFYSNEREEPAHIHVEQAERYAKFWLATVTLAESSGFRSGELAELRRLVFQHRRRFQEAWDGHFGGPA
jgi:hypothetical protein